MAVDYDPFFPEDWQDPYPLYKRLRDEAPLHYAEKSRLYCVSRYDDVIAVLRDHEAFSSRGAFEVMTEHRKLRWSDSLDFLRFLAVARINPLRPGRGPQMLISLDPPRHDEVRNTANRGFTPRRIQAWEPRMHAIVKECMAKLRGDDGFDLVHDLAIPLPVTVIAEILGIEPERQKDFKRWSDTLIAGSSGSQRDQPLGPFLRTMSELQGYLRGVIRARRKAPGDDLISTLIDPVHADTLDEGEIAQLVVLLLVAGNETTTNLIGNTTLALLRNRDQLERVSSEPERIPDLIEESLRYDSPVQLLFRRSTRDVALSGGTIPAGKRVAVLLGAANRDERQFPDPDRFDITRDARGHASFGHGVHFCLGSSLARLEAKCAFEALVPELPGLSVDDHETQYVDSFLVRGPKALGLLPVG